MDTSPCFKSLPTDVICEVYRALAAVDRPARPHPKINIPGNIGFLRLTHVSRRLREIGLAVASLWADMLPAFPAACCEILERAGTAPLRLVLCDDMPNLQSHLDKLPELVQRAKYLTLSFNFFPNFVNGEVVQTAANVRSAMVAKIRAALQATTVQHLRTLRYTVRSELEVDYTFVPFTAPALRSYAGDYLPFSAPNLQTLHLTGHADAKITLPHLLRLLHSTPCLKTLAVFHCQSCNQDRLDAEVPVYLPHLEELNLGGNGESILQLIAYVTHPAPADHVCSWPHPFCIQFREPLDSNQVTRSLQALRSQLPEPGRNPTALTITSEHFIVGWLLLLSDTWDPVRELYPDRCIMLDAQDEIASQRTAVFPKTLVGLAQLYAPSIRTLYVPGMSSTVELLGADHGFGIGYIDLYREALRLLCNVTEISVGPAANNLFNLLAGDQELLLPALVSVIVDVSDVDGLPNDTWKSSRVTLERTVDLKGHARKDWFTTLHAMLSKRHALGGRIRRLVLRGHLCHLAIVRGDGPERTCSFEEVQLDGAISQFTDEIVDERTPCSGVAADTVFSTT
ncbi:hypothetical protein PENSPDRAFT_654789 [Peniophora sp. CONT]|nr:hypothetical protein PENSPDRAFT_654789 [Peniophora sp. CONT]